MSSCIQLALALQLLWHMSCISLVLSLVISAYFGLSFLLAALKKCSMVFNMSLSSSTMRARCIRILLQTGVSVGRIYKVGKRSQMWRYVTLTNENLCHFFPLAHVASLSKINIVKLKTASPRDRLRMWVRRLRPTDRVWVRHSLAMLAFAFSIDLLRNCTTIDFV